MTQMQYKLDTVALEGNIIPKRKRKKKEEEIPSFKFSPNKKHNHFLVISTCPESFHKQICE